MANHYVNQDRPFMNIILRIPVVLWIQARAVSASVYVRTGAVLQCDIISNSSVLYPEPVRFLFTPSTILCGATANILGATMFGYEGSETCKIYKEDSNYINGSAMLAARIPSQNYLEEVGRGKSTFGTNGRSGSGASNAFDGILTNKYSALYSATNPILGVDLGELRKVYLVKIIGGAWTVTSIEIRLGTNPDGSSNPLFATHPGPQPSGSEIFCFSSGVTGRYLSIHKIGVYMGLAEVEVYASKEP